MSMQGKGGVPFEGLRKAMRFALDLEDLDSLIGGAGCEASSIVIENCIVLSRQCVS